MSICLRIVTTCIYFNILRNSTVFLSSQHITVGMCTNGHIASLATLPCSSKSISITHFILLQTKVLGTQNTMIQKSQFLKMQDCSGFCKSGHIWTAVLELHFSQHLSSKLILRFVLKYKKFGYQCFSCQSLLLVLIYLMIIAVQYVAYNYGLHCLLSLSVLCYAYPQCVYLACFTCLFSLLGFLVIF